MTDAALPSFEWSAEDIRREGYRAIDLLTDHLASMRAGPVFNPVPAELSLAAFASAPPELGSTVDDVWHELSRRVLPVPFGDRHPRPFCFAHLSPAAPRPSGCASSSWWRWR